MPFARLISRTKQYLVESPWQEWQEYVDLVCLLAHDALERNRLLAHAVGPRLAFIDREDGGMGSGQDVGPAPQLYMFEDVVTEGVVSARIVSGPRAATGREDDTVLMSQDEAREMCAALPSLRLVVTDSMIRWYVTQQEF